jgi:hypothetical protein
MQEYIVTFGQSHKFDGKSMRNAVCEITASSEERAIELANEYLEAWSNIEAKINFIDWELYPDGVMIYIEQNGGIWSMFDPEDKGTVERLQESQRYQNAMAEANSWVCEYDHTGRPSSEEFMRERMNEEFGPHETITEEEWRKIYIENLELCSCTMEICTIFIKGVIYFQYVYCPGLNGETWYYGKYTYCETRNEEAERC